jgi:phospholipid/cholesterol/gamma-HCH transport system substrate-binding protein
MPRTRSLKWSELKLGAAGIVAIALASALTFAVGGQGGFFWQRYPLHARFGDVSGLKPGAVVRLNGMEVGKVTRVEFAGSEVEVGMEVAKDVRHLITTDSEASMGTLSLLGEPIVDIRAAATGTPLPDGGLVPAGVGTGVAALATSAARSMEEAGALIAEVRAGEGALGSLVADAELKAEMHALVGSAARVARHLEKGQGTLGALAQDPGAYLALRSALENLSNATARLNAGAGAASRLLNDEAMGRSLASASASAEEIAGRLARGEGTAGKLLTDDRLYDRIGGLTERMDDLLAALESGQGTAGQLLRDQRLYDNVTRVTLELGNLIADIQRDPKKYLSVDFSVF